MFVITNASTSVTDADVKVMVRAVAHQLRYDAAPAWGKNPAPVVYTSNPQDAQPGSYLITVLDDSDQADALGYHSEDQGEVIFGRVFARPVLDNGGDALHHQLSVSSVLSHEVLETFCDPTCNSWMQFNDAGDCIALEVGDPVENDSYGVPGVGHGTVTVSNFVLPRWFDPAAEGGVFDHLGNVKTPFAMTKGGYVIKLSKGKVTAVYGEEYPDWRFAGKKSELARTQHRIASIQGAT